MNRKPRSITRLPIRLGPVALLVLLLAACTGTFEVRPPTLLVVAFEDSSPAVGLVRDTFSALEPGQSRTLSFVTGSRRPLPAPAVDVDVVDRAGARPTAVFLLREQGTQTSYLRGFRIDDIDPDDATAFSEHPAYAVLLANGGPGGDEGLLEDPAAPICPVEIEVTGDGRYAAVFEDRSVCGGAEFRAIHIVDLQEATSGGGDALVRSIDAPAPAPAGMFLDQDGGIDPVLREALYFLDPVGLLKRYVFATDSVETLDVAGIPSSADALRDIGRVLDLLVLVDDDRYLLVDLREGASEAIAVDSASDLTRLVRDPFAATDEAVLLAGDELVVHDDVREPALRSEQSAPTRADAAIEPVDRFAYLLGDATIGVYDLLHIDGENVPVTPFAVPEIPSADVLTWTRAQLGL